MTLEELKRRVPEEFRPWVDTYGPALLQMGVEGVKDWLDFIASGQELEAWKELLSNADLLVGWKDLHDEWEAENKRNAERIALQRAAIVSILRICIDIAMSMMGL